MSEKKVVGRNIVVALGIITIVLLVGLVASYTSIISGKDSIIATKNSQIADKSNTISSLNSQISSLNSQVASLQGQVNYLYDTINLLHYAIWVYTQTVNQPANSYVCWTFPTSYAGYLLVQVLMSTTNNTYARVIYSSHGIDYDNQISVGTRGTAAFPVLPCPSIEIRVATQIGRVVPLKP